MTNSDKHSLDSAKIWSMPAQPCHLRETQTEPTMIRFQASRVAGGKDRSWPGGKGTGPPAGMWDSLAALEDSV